MYSAMTPLAQNIKLAVETDDKETWQRHTAEFQRRNQTKKRQREKNEIKQHWPQKSWKNAKKWEKNL